MSTRYDPGESGYSPDEVLASAPRSTPCPLVELLGYQTEHGAILVGYDRDRDDYVAESGRLPQPQRGRSERDAVGKVLDLLELHDARIQQTIADAAACRCPEMRTP